MKIDSGMVAHVAKLASLELSPEESEALAGQLTRIVEHFEELRQIPEELLPELPDAGSMPLRADVARGGPGVADAKANAPEWAHDHFVVPRVVSRGEG